MTESPGVEIRLVARSSDWTAAAADLPGVTAFHGWDWLTMIADVLGMRFAPLEVRDGDRMLGLVPAMLRSRGPVATMNWVPFPYLGPLVRPADLDAVLQALRRWQRSRRVMIARLGFAPVVAPDPSVLGANGYTVEAHTTMTVHLAGRPLDDVERGMHGTVRKRVRRAQREGVNVEDATRDDIVGILPEVIADAFTKRGMETHYPPAIGPMTWERLGGDPSARLAVAKLDGRSIGVMVTITDGQRAYLFQGGVLRADRATNAEVLLHLDALQWAHGAGLEALDMVGAPDPGIASYKASYGAVAESFTVAQRVNSRLYALAQRAQQELGVWRARRRDVSGSTSPGRS